MATKRQLGVEFLREGFRTADADRTNEPDRTDGSSEEDIAGHIAKKRAALTYSPAILRTLRDLSARGSSGVSPRDLFREVRKQLPDEVKVNFDDFRLALNAVYGDRCVEVAGTDDVGDPLYSITKLGLSVAPP
jgi:hypothetical protein